MKTSTKPVGLDTIIRQQLADALVSAAKEQGLSLLEGQLTCDLANGFTILAAPIARTETPTEKELTDGVGLIFAYLSHAESKELPAGFYTIRMATGGYNFKDGSVKISFIDAKGKTAYSFKGATAELRKGAGQSTPSPEDFAVRSVTHGMVCGSRKCFKWDRVGWGKWEYGCIDMDSNPVSCR